MRAFEWQPQVHLSLAAPIWASFIHPASSFSTSDLIKAARWVMQGGWGGISPFYWPAAQEK